MTTVSTSELRSWVGHTAVDPRGAKVGRITDIYFDDATRLPEWLAVTTGTLRKHVSFVPLAGASPAGDDIRVAYDKDTITHAPAIEADEDISQAQENELFRYYGWEGVGGQEAGGPGAPPTTAAAGTGMMAGRETGETAETGETDTAMTRSEEELDVEKRTRAVGRARLHKWVETEERTFTVPVRRERARVVTEPITDENRDAAMAGPEISEADHEVTLTEEEIEVQKRTVPKERVRLEKETETEEVPVSEEVRKERIERSDEQPDL